MLSIGTGWFRERHQADAFMRLNNTWKAKIAMTSMLHDTQLLAIKTMQMLAVPPQRNAEFNFRINSEVEKMAAMAIANPPLLTFRRLDASLELADVEPFLNGPLPSNKRLGSKEIAKIRDDLTQIDNAKLDNMKRLFEIGLHSTAAITTESVAETLDVIR